MLWQNGNAHKKEISDGKNRRKNEMWKRRRNRRKKKQEDNNGSMTVELALLMPLILAVIVLVIHGSIFLYNRETIETIACLSVHRGLQMEHDGKKAIQNEVEHYVKQSLENKLLLSPAVTAQVTVSLTSIHVTIELEQKNPIPGIAALLPGKGNFSAKVSKKGTRMDPADVLWAVSGVRSAVSSGQTSTIESGDN